MTLPERYKDVELRKGFKLKPWKLEELYRGARIKQRPVRALEVVSVGSRRGKVRGTVSPLYDAVEGEGTGHPHVFR